MNRIDLPKIYTYFILLPLLPTLHLLVQGGSSRVSQDTRLPYLAG